MGFSSIAFGDIDNDNDLDLVLTGQEGNDVIARIYKNQEPINNSPPSVPVGMAVSDVGGFWRFDWNASTDDYTHQNTLRYKIALGTNTSGLYNYSSTQINYPRGQANLGNVRVVSGPYFQSKIPTTKMIFWKVCAIDSAFKRSAFSPENNSSDITGPARVDLVSPGNNTWTSKSIPEFIWNTTTDNYSGVSNYTIEISSNYFSNIKLTKTTNSTNCTIPAGLPDCTWFWRVRAMDRANNYGEWSMTNSVKIDTQPPLVSGMIPEAIKLQVQKQ